MKWNLPETDQRARFEDIRRGAGVNAEIKDANSTLWIS